MINQTRQQTKYCLGLSSQSSKRGNNEEEEAAFEKMRKDIEANQDNALSLCTEKVLLARQAYELVTSFHNSSLLSVSKELCSVEFYSSVLLLKMNDIPNSKKFMLSSLYYALIQFLDVNSM